MYPERVPKVVEGLSVGARKNALRVLDFLSSDTPVLRANMVSKRMEVNKSTASRWLADLSDAGLLERRPDATFVAGHRSMELSKLFLKAHPQLKNAEAVLEEMARRYGFTGFVGKLVGNQYISLSIVKGDDPFCRDCRPKLRSAIDTAGGLAMLSRLTVAQSSRLVGDVSDATLDGVLATLEETKRRGFVYKANPYVDNVTSVASVLSQPKQHGDLSLCFAWPDAAVDTRRMSEMSDHLMRQVQALQALG